MNKKVLGFNIFCLVGFLLTLKLGFWQLDRFNFKNELLENYAIQREKPVLFNNQIEGGLIEEYIGRAVEFSGYYLREPTILLENQIKNGKAGYLQFNIFCFHDKNVCVLKEVDWLVASYDRTNIPYLSNLFLEDKKIVGFVKKPVIPLKLSGYQEEYLPQGIIRLQYLDVDFISASLGVKLESLVITNEDNNNIGLSAEKHMSYAVQWFLLSLVVVIYWSFWGVSLIRKRVWKNKQ